MELPEVEKQLKVARTELKNVRSQIHGLRQTHLKDVQRLRDLISSGQMVSPPSEKMPSSEPSPNTYTFTPLGHLRSVFKTKNGTPRQPTVCSEARGSLRIEDGNLRAGLSDLAQFSHVWLLFVFHANGPKPFSGAKVAPPRRKHASEGGNKRVGVFSTRSPHRPNPIGLSLAAVEGVDVENGVLELKGIDLIDATPILDVKPYIPSYDMPKTPEEAISTENPPSEVRVPSWINNEADNLRVSFTPRALEGLQRFSRDSEEFPLKSLETWQDLQKSARDILSADPRSVYRREKCRDQLYYLTVDSAHLTVWFDDDENMAEVVKVKRDPML